MPWRVPTQEDLATRLSDAEIAAYSSTTTFGDPITELLHQTADEVRGYVAANRTAVLSPVAHSLPPMLIGPCLDIVVINLLKVVDLNASETRQKAYDRAYQLLKEISEGKITPEPGSEGASAVASIAAPSISVRPPIL